MNTPIRPGDTVRVLDTPYTRAHGDAIEACIGHQGEVLAVDTYEGMADLLGFEAIYTVRVAAFEICLIAEDMALVIRPARIT